MGRLLDGALHGRRLANGLHQAILLWLKALVEGVGALRLRLDTTVAFSIKAAGH